MGQRWTRARVPRSETLNNLAGVYRDQHKYADAERLLKRALAILVAEQDLDFCLGLASRAYVMDRGTVVREVSRNELFDDQALLQELLGV